MYYLITTTSWKADRYEFMCNGMVRKNFDLSSDNQRYVTCDQCNALRFESYEEALKFKTRQFTVVKFNGDHFNAI